MAERALVLGGGGPVGFAWQCGLVAGFAKAGVDLAAADFILGTSAGAMTGARLALGHRPAELAEPLLALPATAAMTLPTGPKVLDLLEEAQCATSNPAETRRKVAALALEETAGDEAGLLAMIAQAIGVSASQPWPAPRFACTAVDAEDGGFQLWEARSGAPLLNAVASSCALPGVLPAVTVAGRRYVDGGLRSFTNADLAVGRELVVVIAVQPPGGAAFVERRLNEEIETLKQAGSTVVSITPEEDSARAMGQNLLDFGRMSAAAQAGLDQAAAQAQILRPLWQST